MLILFSLCARDLSILGFWILGGPGSNFLWIPRDDCTYHTLCVHLSVDTGVASSVKTVVNNAAWNTDV